MVRSRGVYNDEDLIKGHTVPLIRALNLRRARDSVLEAGHSRRSLQQTEALQIF